MITYEYFHVGDKSEFGDYLVTEAEIIEFSTKYDPQPIHTDTAFAANSFHGQLIASGWLTAAIMMRLLCDHIMKDSSGIGSPGVDQLRWLRPVVAGDRLKATVEVTATRESKSKPGVGIVNYDIAVFNGKEQPVMTLSSTGMFLTKAAVANQTA